MTDQQQVWPAAGVEVAADRARTWVARAAELADGRIVVELMDPLPTTAAAPVLEWVDAWQAALAVDPRSPSATLVEPLGAELGRRLHKVGAHELAVAHGVFSDLLDAGGLRIRGHYALTDAARLAATRRLAGSDAPDRYGGQTDLAPLVASELAVWVLTSSPKPPQPFAIVA
jgi:hypothetical protein